MGHLVLTCPPLKTEDSLTKPSVMGRPQPWQDLSLAIFSACLSIWRITILPEVRALPANWDDLSFLQVGLVVFYFLLVTSHSLLGYLLMYRLLAYDKLGWWVGCILLTFDLIDNRTEEDTRTGLPKLEETGPRENILELMIRERILEEMLVFLFQKMRPAKIDCFVFDFKTIVGYISPRSYTFIMIAHFITISDENFMIVF